MRAGRYDHHMSSSNCNRREFLAAAAVTTALRPQRVMGANNRIGLAVIGCGNRGHVREVLPLLSETNTDFLAVCDTWRQQRETAAAAVKQATGKAPEQYVNYHDVLAQKNIDAVVIATPDHQHCTMLVDALRAGKDVYIEKPLAMNMRELNDAVDAVRRSGRVVQVGTQVRSWAPSVAARAFVAAGGLGRIFKIEQSRNSYYPYWQRVSERSVAEGDVDWKAFLMHSRYRPFEADQYAGWYGYRDFSLGPHSQLMVHFIDLVHFVTGAKYPKRVVAMGGTWCWKDKRTAPDSIEVVLEYPDDGFLVRYNSTFGTNDNSYLKFFGTRGVMDATRWNEPWKLKGEKAAADAIPPGAGIPVVESTDHMKNFLDCVRSRKTPAAPIEAGYAHAVAALMADASYVHGTRMVHDPSKRTIKAG